MSTVQVANIDFETTVNNQIAYTSSNTLTVKVGGSNVMVVNTGGLYFVQPVSIAVGNNLTINVTSSANVSVNNYNLNSNAGLQVSGKIVINGVITPATIDANTAAFNPPITNETIIRFSANSSNTSALSIYGITAGTNGQIVILSNIGTKAVILSSEDVANETAANRFSLPQSILLNGYQSISLFYDGTSARWKPTDTSYVSFYKGLLTKAFFAGGNTSSPTAVTTADRTTYSSETTAAVPGANLSQARNGIGSAGNSCKGFFIGGSIPITDAALTADRTTYSTEATAAVPGANLTQARFQLAAAGNACKGFFSSGCSNPSPLLLVTTTCRTTYSSETTAAVPGANLSEAKRNFSAVGNSDKGFFAGGQRPIGGSFSTNFDRTTYSSETTSSIPGTNLSQGRQGQASAGNNCKGFFSGGNISSAPGATTTACRTTYSTETNSAVPGANLSQARYRFSAAGNNCKGFFAGGLAVLSPPSPVITRFATADRTIYSTETTAAVPGANLSQARDFSSAI